VFWVVEEAGCQYRQNHTLWPDGQTNPTLSSVHTPPAGLCSETFKHTHTHTVNDPNTFNYLESIL